MEKYILLGFALLQFLGSNGQGLAFTKNLNWSQVKEKAKIENKYIFIDVYATWCAPCKAMDRDVYSSDDLALFFNENFISVKLQLDKTEQDSKEVKSWYLTASKMKRDYNINVLPTFLFFSADGKLVSKSNGYKTKNDLIAIAEAAKDPSRQYISKLERFKKGRMNYNEMPLLALNAKTLGDTADANLIAGKFINEYVFELNKKDIYNKETLNFMGNFIGDKGSRVFDFFTQNSAKINEVLGDHRSEYFIRNSIASLNIPSDETWLTIKPNWDSLENTLMKKYGSLGVETLYGKRMIYSYYIKDWQNYSKYYRLYLKTALERPEYNINDITFELFKYINDQSVLMFACDTVMKYAMEEWYQNDPAAYDTYANLLYKTKHLEEAIVWEQRAVRMRKGTKEGEMFFETLNRMKKGQPTWITTMQN